MTRAGALAAALACLVVACGPRQPPIAPPEAPPAAPEEPAVRPEEPQDPAGRPEPEEPAVRPEEPDAPVLEGVASWYGPRFQGRRTASGERFDQDELTAAHASLPFGSRVRVTNLDNGRSVVVRVNDRPGRDDRIIDVSRAAGRLLGLTDPGTARVRLELLE